MQSEDSEFRSYIEQEARRLSLIDESELEEPSNLQIDFEEALRSGVFICGGKGTAKSNLAITIADKLMRKGVIVKVFDISRVWLKSSIPRVFELGIDALVNVGIYDSAVFDLSRLTPKIAKEFIAKLLESEWNRQIGIPEEERKTIVYVFEEVQSLIPQGQLRSDEAQYLLRLLSAGRNFKLGYIAITQRAALTDTSVFELSFQRYFSRMDGQNDLKKVSNYIGSEKARQLQSLRLGEFFYDKGIETKLIKTGVFRSNSKPNLVPAKPFVRRERQQEQPELSGAQVAQLAFMFLMLLIFLATVGYAFMM